MCHVELKSLIGKHLFSGYDEDSIEIKDDYLTENCNVSYFVLDDRVYMVAEDPGDGYRSSMRWFKKVDRKVKNTFQPIEVLATIQDKCEYGGTSDILQLTDVITGKVVMEVGTENTDDYYPCYVANFKPENMNTNHK